MSNRGLTIEEMNKRIEGKSRLLVLGFDNPYMTSGGQSQRRVKALCKCGNIIRVLVKCVVRLETTSCGCYAREITRLRSTKFYPVIPALHHVYNSMIRRCYDSENKDYKYYGGRGVTVCQSWKKDYQEFLDWAIANGYKKGLHLDKDTRGNGLFYSPDTCCWITRTQNINRTRRNPLYLYKGEQLSLAEICRKYGLKYSRICDRIHKMGMTIDEAINYSGRYKKTVK